MTGFSLGSAFMHEAERLARVREAAHRDGKAQEFAMARQLRESSEPEPCMKPLWTSCPRLWQRRDGPRRQSDDVDDYAGQAVGLRMRQVSVHAQRAARQLPELLLAAVAVEAEDQCLGADAETFKALVHQQGSYGQTSERAWRATCG